MLEWKFHKAIWISTYLHFHKLFLTKITSYLHKMLLFFPIQFSNSFKSFPDAKWMLIFDQVEGINNQKFKQISKELPSAPT